MKRLVVLLLVAFGGVAIAQPVPSPGLRKVTHDSTLTGAGTLASALGLAPCGTIGQTWIWNGSAFACGAPSSGGVTNVSTLAPLQGGPITTTGTVSLINCAANQIYQMNAGGTAWACASASGGGITNSAGANVLMKSDGTNAVASSWTDASGTSTTTGNLSVNGGVTLGDTSADSHTVHGALAMADGPLVLTPTTSAQTSGTLNNWAIGSGSFYRVTTTGGLGITGIDSTGRADGSMLYLLFPSGNAITLNNESASSSAANRIHVPGGLNLSLTVATVSGGVLLQYSTADSRWNVLWWGGLRFPQLTADSGLTVSASGANITGGTTSTSTGSPDSVAATYTGTAQTGDRTAISASNTGSSNTTAAGRAAYGLKATCTNTISSGANTLSSICGYFSNASSGANINAWALLTDVGDVKLNATSGSTKAHGDFSVDGNTTLTGTATLSSTLTADTGNISLAGTSGTTTIGAGGGTVNVGSLTTGTTNINSPTVTFGSGSASTANHWTDKDGTSRPTVANCGTGATVVGNDASGVITTGTSPTSSCAMTFKTAYGSNLSCVVTARSAAGFSYTLSTTALSLTATGGGAIGASVKLDYECRDH